MSAVEKHPEMDVTKIVNVDDEPFDIYVDGEVRRHLEPGEEKSVPIFMAKLGAKHLIDRVLQKKGIHNTLQDTPERRDLIAKILPELAEEAEYELKAPTKEAFEELVKERLAQQEKEIKALKQQLGVSEETPKAEKPKQSKKTTTQ